MFEPKRSFSQRLSPKIHSYSIFGGVLRANRVKNGHFCHRNACWISKTKYHHPHRLNPFLNGTAIGTMISNFFVLSPRGDTIIAKKYRNEGETTAHERSNTEAFFRKVKFWDDSNKDGSSKDSGDPEEGASSSGSTGDAPPVFLMPDGLTYMHVKRNGLLFGCSTARNVSAVTVIEVRLFKSS